MPDRPPELRSLLEAADPRAREAAWAGFVASHSRLLLHFARRVMPDGDGAMDAYAHLLDQLQREEFRTLRLYQPTECCTFTTWLGVVARRTCVDYYRHRHGRPRGNGADPRAAQERAARRRLDALVGSPAELARLEDRGTPDAEGQVRSAQLRAALDAALASLAADDRLLVRLRFEDGLSAAGIARVIGLPTPFHVYRRLRVVCAALRARLQALGVDDGAP